MNKNEFKSNKYWENRYNSGGNSGSGSYGKLAQFKADTINKFIKEEKIQNIVEFGCGDGNNLSLYSINSYIGIDVSNKAIKICKSKFKNDLSKKFFTLSEFKMQENSNKNAELILSLDVIYHLIEDEVYNEYMELLFNTSSKYIIIYASNYNEEFCTHVKHRKFTNWIKENKKNWSLKNFIKNIYKYDSKNPTETTFADFYIFERD